MFKHPDQTEEEKPGAAFGFRCPFCRTDNAVCSGFDELKEGFVCGLKEAMAYANVTEVTVRTNCGEDCECMTTDVHLTHLPCRERGCYSCTRSKIEWRLLGDDLSDDDVDNPWADLTGEDDHLWYLEDNEDIDEPLQDLWRLFGDNLSHDDAPHRSM